MVDDSKNISIDVNVTGGNINIGGTQNFYGSFTVQPYFPDSVPQEEPAIPLADINQAFNAASAHLANIRGTIADTEIAITRSEVSKILNWIDAPTANEENPQKLALITGKPGQGKSVLMQQLINTLRDGERTVLGIKADDLAAINRAVLSLDDLQTLLHLPTSVEKCVKVTAANGLCVVLIDQLDTLALTLNTDDQSLRVVVNLIDRLREIPNVKVVVSCRDFERLNDPVLGGIKIDQSFQVGELQEADIDRVLQEINQPQFDDLPNPLRHLLKTPLYLDIYARIVLSSEGSNLAQVTTLQDLYGRLWSLRIERTDQNAPLASERREAVFHLVDLMQRQRKLKLHVSSLDDYSTARQYLQRNGFIQVEGHSLSFLHQTLFSYCYARKFVSEQRSLSDEVFASPQGFFDRQLIIEVFQHLRSTDQQTYHAEISDLLFPPAGTHIRYHLRLLILKWLAWQVEPTDQEYSLILRLERTNLNEFQRWLRNTDNNEGWFQRLKDDITRWLASEDDYVITIAMDYIYNFRDKHIAFFVECIRPYLDRSEKWNRRIALMLIYLKDWSEGNDAANLLIYLVRSGAVSIQSSNHSLVTMANSNIMAGCQLLRLHAELAFKIYLDLKSKQTDQYSRPFPEDLLREAVDSWEARGFISVVARSNPQAILDNLLPWFLESAVTLTEEQESSSRYYPSNWFFNDLHEMPTAHSREGISLAQGILQALSHIAQTNPESFRKKVTELAPVEVRIIQQLLLCAFRANPGEYVTDIFEFLTGDQRRLYIQPDARLLLGTTYEHSDQSLRNKWENFIFSFPQRTIDEEEISLDKWRRYLRYWQSEILDFLLSINDALLSDYARRKKHEIMRLPQFENYEIVDGFKISTFGAVEAPIPNNRQKNLSDADWLRILRKYDDETDWGKQRKRRHILEGGVVEMSRALLEQVKLNPERFYRLSKEFDATISSQYISAIINGFAHHESNADPHWMFELFQRFHSQITGHSRIGVSNALAKMVPAEVPDDIIDVLINWAKDDPDPDCEEERAQMSDILSDTASYSDGLINRAINHVRSSTLRDVCRILFEKEPVQLERIYEIIQRGVDEDCPSVRTMAIQQLAQWQNKTKDHKRGIQLFEIAMVGHPILLTTHPVQRYLNWLSFVDPELSLSYLQAMIEITHEPTQYIAAQLICVAGLYEKKGYIELASDLHLSENPAIRRGAATIYAQEIGKPEKTAICCERLLVLMEDEDEQVRVQCTRCFNRLQADHFTKLQNFFRQFINTSALQYGGDDFIEFLTRIGIVTPEEQRLSLSLVKDLLDAAGTDIGNYDRGFVTLQRETTLFLRNLYDKTIEHHLRENIMDLFDKMLQSGSSEAHKMLQSEDAEWMPQK